MGLACSRANVLAEADKLNVLPELRNVVVETLSLSSSAGFEHASMALRENDSWGEPQGIPGRKIMSQ